MKIPLSQWSSTFSIYRPTKSSQMRWRLSAANLNLLTTDFLLLCYLPQLFLCSGSASHRLKNTILVTHVAFHIVPFTSQKKKMLSASEETWSWRSHIKQYFHATAGYKPLRVRSREKKNFWCYLLCKRLQSFTDDTIIWNISAL